MCTKDIWVILVKIRPLHTSREAYALECNTPMVSYPKQGYNGWGSGIADIAIWEPHIPYACTVMPIVHKMILVRLLDAIAPQSLMEMVDDAVPYYTIQGIQKYTTQYKNPDMQLYAPCRAEQHVRWVRLFLIVWPCQYRACIDMRIKTTHLIWRLNGLLRP